MLPTRVDGAITPVITDPLEEGPHTAERDGYAAYGVEIGTPGGLMRSVGQVVRDFLPSPVPVTACVTPPGAGAASAAASITASAHIVTMTTALGHQPRHGPNTEVIGMSSAMDEEHAFARIERRLAREDPELARRIDAINSQFTGPAGERATDRADGRLTDRAAGEERAGRPADDGDERSWTAVIAVVLVTVTVLGLLLTAILSSPGGEQEPLQPHGPAPPAVSDVREEPPSPGVP
ncbi:MULTISPECIES: hypothetical protein [Streptomyces]|uniref:Uncharacterized protein n=1 Tax=Streptomyces fimbriatus TaxID=68197 RepID=A0ABW0D9J1_STRFI